MNSWLEDYLALRLVWRIHGYLVSTYEHKYLLGCDCDTCLGRIEAIDILAARCRDLIVRTGHVDLPAAKMLELTEHYTENPTLLSDDKSTCTK